MYKNQCMINPMMYHSFEDNAGICQLTEVLKIFQKQSPRDVL